MDTDQTIKYQYMPPREYLKDYLDFGIYNGVISIKSHLVFWDLMPERAQCIRMAKIIAEYGRAIEELFVYLYAFSEQARSSDDVFYKRLVYYKSRELNSFIDDQTFDNLYGLLGLKPREELAIHFNNTTDLIDEWMDEFTEHIKALKEERTGTLQKLYNKLKHPFLVYSKVPDGIKDNLSFGIVESAIKEEKVIFHLRPHSVSYKAALEYLKNTMAIGGMLKFFISSFIVSYKPWNVKES